MLSEDYEIDVTGYLANPAVSLAEFVVDATVLLTMCVAGLKYRLLPVFELYFLYDSALAHSMLYLLWLSPVAPS